MNIPSADKAELLFEQHRKKERNERIARQVSKVEEGFASATSFPLVVRLVGPVEDELLELIVEKGYCVKPIGSDGYCYIRISLPEPVTPQ